MSVKRNYHKWTEQETVLLYKIVVGSDRNWRIVERVFPNFTLLQLQNKFTFLEQQYKIKSSGNEQQFLKSCSEEINRASKSLLSIYNQESLKTQKEPENTVKEESSEQNERSYHHWTREETLLLYKTVHKNIGNWKEVMKVFPQFSLLQIQNKYVMIQKQFKLRMRNKEESQDFVLSDDTLQMLLDLISKKE
ncbi:Myb-like_DNA-binding domain-containing protein [Hexamita inflata]|uniref:Myb-like DNA-binding domain-containing protein n=1 Tax=Hexamita inflata TaxID=28002 RepID=A0AA86RB04_9EUKA|nr:Myb-like DNA-binding domain-containing protein [Hexamita inflata]